MTPTAFYNTILIPASRTLPAINSKASRVLLMAIAGQESGWNNRIQIPGGEAHGYWQCELEGAVANVISHPSSGAMLENVCNNYDITFNAETIFEAITYHDILAYSVARLALFENHNELPLVGNAQGAWKYYLDTWKPGKPKLNSWADIYSTSVSLVK